MIILKEEYLNNMKELLKDDFEKFLAIYEQTPYKAIRVNTKKIPFDEFKKLLPEFNQKVPYANAFYVDSNLSVGQSPYHHAGLFYVQEPSAMQPVLSTSYEGDCLVLDMCASPGGKSGQIAELITNDSTLVSNEIITNRAKILKENMDRLGYSNVIVTSTPPENLVKLGEIFDYIILDAPCSGEGMFRKEPNAIKEWNSGINQMNSKRQYELLNIAKKLLKPSGKIIYSTCTFSPLENEKVVEKFLSENTNFELCKINPSLLDYSMSITNENLRRVMPHKNKGEGQFYAILKNKEPKIIDSRHYTYLDGLKKSEKQLVEKFIKDYTSLDNVNIKSYQGNILLPPKKEINTTNLYVLKYGITLGKIEKNRFIPHHNFFTSLGNYFKCKINLSAKNAEKYLKGEQIEVDDNDFNGYCCVCFNGYPLGGGKISNNKINNLYPKYLRTC